MFNKLPPFAIKAILTQEKINNFLSDYILLLFIIAKFFNS